MANVYMLLISFYLIITLECVVAKDASMHIRPVDIYRNLLKTKRQAHREAVASMLKMSDNFEKQHKMVKMVIEKIFQVNTDNKAILETKQFSPTDAFPEDESTRDALASIVENTAFLGEVALHLPDVTHDIIERNNDWKTMIDWSIKFCNATKIFQKNDKKMLHLMAQELDVIPKEPDFNNPYKDDEMIEKAVDEEVDKIMKEKKKQEKRDKKREKNRGPRLGGGREEL